MKTTAFLTTFALAISASVSAQQDPLSTQFWNTLLHINPATAGLEYRHEAHMQYRNQWNRVSGAPSTGFANYSAKIDKIHGAAGVSYEFNMVGFSHTHTALGHYAFHIPIRNSILSVGVAGGTQTYALDWDRLVFPESSNDPLVPRGGQRTSFTMNTGVAFHAPKWNAGFGVTHLNAPSLSMESVIGAGTTSDYNAARHYYLTADYKFGLGAGSWSIQPRVLAATDAVKYYAQVSAVLSYSNAWLSANYRTTESFGGAIGYDFRGKWRVGYGYEIWASKLHNGNPVGTHEITIGFLLK